jgi:D-glycero-D-manno-heptose 1,7-bisphosphate phosphatase
MSALRKALFLDRDGVINVEKNYVYRIEDFEFIDGIFELCALAQNRGFALIVITNQAGIGRGYYTEADFQHLTGWMLEAFRGRGIEIDRVYHCPCHPTAGIGEYRRESFDRKPNPGMILQARKDFDLDLSQCVLIGDKKSDIEAGRAAGVGCLIKLVPGTPPVERQATHGVLEFSDLKAARDWLDGHSTDGMACTRN